MTTDPPDLSVEEIDEGITNLSSWLAPGIKYNPWEMDVAHVLSAYKMARRCAVADGRAKETIEKLGPLDFATMERAKRIVAERVDVDFWYHGSDALRMSMGSVAFACAKAESERDQLRTQLHEEGERATRLQDELDKGNDATPDRRFQAACASLTGLRAHHGEHSQELHGEDLRRVAIKDADALLARLATPPARAEGKES